MYRREQKPKDFGRTRTNITGLMGSLIFGSIFRSFDSFRELLLERALFVVPFEGR